LELGSEAKTITNFQASAFISNCNNRTRNCLAVRSQKNFILGRFVLREVLETWTL